MQRNIKTLLLQLAACLALMAGITASAADVSGTYSWTQAGRNGGPDRKTTLMIKVEGDKVTGTMTAPAGGRGGQGGQAPAAPTPIELKDGKIKGDEISFSVTREGRQGGTPTTIKYAGKVAGDTIKIKYEQPGRGGGEPTPVEVEAKKEAK